MASASNCSRSKRIQNCRVSQNIESELPIHSIKHRKTYERELCSVGLPASMSGGSCRTMITSSLPLPLLLGTAPAAATAAVPWLALVMPLPPVREISMEPIKRSEVGDLQ